MKKLLTLTILFFIGFNAHAQNSDYYDRMEHIFENIDPAKVTTGYLKEFGIRLNTIEKL